MSEPAEKTESLRDYAEMLGSPDGTTTARMRARLDEYMARRRSARRRWLLGGVLLVAAGVGTALLMSRDSAPVLTADHERTIEVGGARIVVHAGATVEITGDAALELRAGEIAVELADDIDFVVQSGAFEVRGEPGGAFTVRHASELPVVTAVRAHAVIRGPGLPDAGIRVLPR